jgi:hypothetical protein
MSNVLSVFKNKKGKSSFEPKAYGIELCRGVGFDYTTQVGDYGIEIEVEGTGLPGNIPNWVRHDDNSLRGGSEYVTDGAVSKAQAIANVSSLFDTFTFTGTRLNNSYRTSTHVHVNMRSVKVNTMAAFVALWGMFEDVLAAWCGPTRAGNLFSLRMSDSSYAVDGWIRGFKTGDFSYSRDMRYLALNPACLRTLGTLEIRLMRAVENVGEFEKWIEAIDRIKTHAGTYSDPSIIGVDFSTLGGIGFLETVFAGLPILDELLAVDNAGQLVRDGYRRIQPILYVIPWASVLPEIEKVYVPNPFGALKPKIKRIFLDNVPPMAWEAEDAFG